MKWPNKSDREAFEIAGFIDAYARLPGARVLSVVQKSEKPDYVVRDTATGDELGIELTSVYLSDRSVPDVHMATSNSSGVADIDCDIDELTRYKTRLIQAIEAKIQRARSGYDLSRPLVLAIYVNEYTSIYLGEAELQALAKRHESLFDTMEPFNEVVFWNLTNGGIFQVIRGT